jgi:hypothetical protein
MVHKKVTAEDTLILILKYLLTAIGLTACGSSKKVKQSRYRPGVAQRVPGS